MSDAALDRLVEEIAQRVRVRLHVAPASGTGMPGLRDQPCADDPGTCSGCGHCVVRRPDAARAVVAAGAARLGAGVDSGAVDTRMARMIDHTLLKPDATADEIRRLCEEARRYHFAAVCVNSANVGPARALLAGSDVMVCAVVGFPLGAMATAAKAFEAREAVRSGAAEIDMVINLGALRSRDYALVEEDIRRVVQAAHPAPVKVILETGGLSHEEKVIGVTVAKIAGAAFVKTSTGFGPGGASVEDVALMRRLVGDALGVKASGGVRTHEDAARMIQAGANRIGASASVAIITHAAAGDVRRERGRGARTPQPAY